MAGTSQAYCEICGTSFDSRDELETHNARHHQQRSRSPSMRDENADDAERNSSAGRVRRDDRISES